MKDQHTLIKGYRDLPQADIDLMNKIKAHAEETKKLIIEVDQHVKNQYGSIESIQDDDAAEQELRRMETSEPEMWIGHAKFELQTGYMKLIRAVAQPTSF